MGEFLDGRWKHSFKKPFAYLEFLYISTVEITWQCLLESNVHTVRSQKQLTMCCQLCLINYSSFGRQWNQNNAEFCSHGSGFTGEQTVFGSNSSPTTYVLEVELWIRQLPCRLVAALGSSHATPPGGEHTGQNFCCCLQWWVTSFQFFHRQSCF